MDAVAFSIRPTTSGPMASSQICLTLGDCQIDNQMYAKGSYDFPVILKGHEVTNVKKLLPQDLGQHWSKELIEKSHFKLDITVELDTPTNGGDSGLEVFLKAVALKVSPMEVFIEDVFMYKMSAVLQSFSPSHHAAAASPQRFQITKNAKNYIIFFCEIDWSHLCLQHFDKF